METLQSILSEFRLKGYFSISQATEFTEKCLGKRGLLDFLEDDTSSAKEDALNLVKEIVAPEVKSSGTADDYHNYAVLFARSEEYDISCDILLCGLNRYPLNNDLLADYLIYAIKSSNSDHYDKCLEMYETLQKLRPKFWNWRAYDFSISFLLDQIERGVGGEPEVIQLQCLELAREFQKRLPTNELAYVAEAKIYLTFNEQSKRVSVLKKAMNKKGMRVVRVAITLAEIYMDKNMSDEALMCIRRALTDFADTKSRTEPSYVYVLSVISKASKFMNERYANDNVEQAINQDDLAKEILTDWKKAQRFEIKDEYFFRVAKSLVKLIEIISDIKLDEDEDY